MKEDRDLLLVAVFTTLTVVLWVMFELIKTTKTTTIPQPLQQVVAPFSGKIDTDILNTLENRQTYD